MARIAGSLFSRFGISRSKPSGSTFRCRYIVSFALVTAAGVMLQTVHAQSDESSATVIGKAAGTTQKAKDEACHAARREAIIQVCGARINAYTNVEDFAVKRDRILVNPIGYITSEKIKRTWDDGEFSYCDMFATVTTGRFESDFKAMFDHIREDAANPRCVVRVVEDNDVNDHLPPRINGVVQTRLENYFLEHGVHLMDRGVVDDVQARDVQLAEMNQDFKALAQRASAFKADVLVFGSAEAKQAAPKTLAGYTIQTWDVTLTIRVIQADSAQLLASNTYLPEKPINSAAGGTGDEALKKLTDESAPRILKDVAEAWRKRLTSHHIFELTVENCSRSAFQKVIKPALQKHRFVQQGDEGIKLREAENNVAAAEVYWSGDLDSLADAVEDLQLEGIKLQVEGQSANRVRCQVLTASP